MDARKDIFLLEDDKAIGMGLVYSLEKEGYRVTHAETVKQAMEILAGRSFAFCILDINLPDGNGYEVCKAIKEKSDTPVIFLTAYDDEVNVIMGLELGADDYICKPFRVRELMARIKAILRRTEGTSGGLNQASGSNPMTGGNGENNKITYPSDDDGIVCIQNIYVHTKEAKVYKYFEKSAWDTETGAAEVARKPQTGAPEKAIEAGNRVAGKKEEAGNRVVGKKEEAGNRVAGKNEEAGNRERKEIELTAMEYRLLLIFINNRGLVLSRNRLLEDIWDVSGDFVNDNTLTVYIKRLRDKIEDNPADPQIIKTVRGMGYILEKEIQ